MSIVLGIRHILGRGAKNLHLVYDVISAKMMKSSFLKTMSPLSVCNIAARPLVFMYIGSY